MLTSENFDLAAQVLMAYESAYVPDHQKMSDIQEGLYWDSKKEFFSMDFGLALRGEAESFRIYRGVEDYLKNRHENLNQYNASVVYAGEVYFFEIVE